VNPTLRGSFGEPTAVRFRLRPAPNHALPPETDSRGLRVLPGGRRPYSRLRAPPPPRPSALTFERPGAAEDCGRQPELQTHCLCTRAWPQKTTPFFPNWKPND
jgi:hypothetical protein